MSKRIRGIRKNNYNLSSRNLDPSVISLLKREFNFEPYRKQEEFLASRANRVAFVGARRTGKTEILVISAILNAIASCSKKILIIGPQKYSLVEIFNRIRKNINKSYSLSHLLERDVSRPYHKMEFYNGSTIRGINGSSLLSSKGTNSDYIYIDEPGFIKDEFIYKNVLPAVQASEDTRLYLLGNPPVNRHNRFFREFSEREDVKTVNCSMAEVFGKKMVEEIQGDYIQEYFHTECLGKFI